MQNCVFFFNPLVTNIFRNCRFISKLANRVHEISISPEFASPKLGFHFWMLFENLFGRDAFQHGDQRGWTQLWNTLNQKMDMILVSANLQKMNIIPFLNFQTHVFQSLINCFTEDHPTIFGRTNKMVQQYRYIMRFMYVFAFAHTYKVKIITPQSGGGLTQNGRASCRE